MLQFQGGVTMGYSSSSVRAFDKSSRRGLMAGLDQLMETLRRKASHMSYIFPVVLQPLCHLKPPKHRYRRQIPFPASSLASYSCRPIFLPQIQDSYANSTWNIIRFKIHAGCLSRGVRHFPQLRLYTGRSATGSKSTTWSFTGF